MRISRPTLLFRHSPLAVHSTLLSPTASSTLGDMQKLPRCRSLQRMEVKSTMKGLLALAPQVKQLQHPPPNPYHREERGES